MCPAGIVGRYPSRNLCNLLSSYASPPHGTPRVSCVSPETGLAAVSSSCSSYPVRSASDRRTCRAMYPTHSCWSVIARSQPHVPACCCRRRLVIPARRSWLQTGRHSARTNQHASPACCRSITPRRPRQAGRAYVDGPSRVLGRRLLHILTRHDQQCLLGPAAATSVASALICARRAASSVGCRGRGR